MSVKKLLLAFGIFSVVVFTFKATIVPLNSSAITMRGYDTFYHGWKFTGLLYEFYSFGRIYRVVPYWRGLKQGKEVHWYPSGTRWLERSFDRGVLQGKSLMWFDGGAPKYMGNYDHGEADGEAWSWYPSGQVTDYHLYSQGRELAYKAWTFDGKPYYNYVYQDGKKVGITGGSFCKAPIKKSF